MLGNFIGDFVPGKQLERYPPAWQLGIRLHRALDAYSDQHPASLWLKDLLRPTQGKYAPVVADVLWDYCLATDWADYHPAPLPQFAQMVYTTMQARRGQLPEGVQQFLPHMVANNWLVNYGTFYGIERSLAGLARRASFQNVMPQALALLKAEEKAIRQQARSLLPEAKTFAERFAQSG